MTRILGGSARTRCWADSARGERGRSTSPRRPRACGGDGDLSDHSNATVRGNLVYACLGRTLYAEDRKGRQKHALTFPDETLRTAYSPVLTRADTEYAYVGTGEGIAAVDLSAEA